MPTRRPALFVNVVCRRSDRRLEIRAQKALAQEDPNEKQHDGDRCGQVGYLAWVAGDLLGKWTFEATDHAQGAELKYGDNGKKHDPEDDGWADVIGTKEVLCAGHEHKHGDGEDGVGAAGQKGTSASSSGSWVGFFAGEKAASILDHDLLVWPDDEPNVGQHDQAEESTGVNGCAVGALIRTARAAVERYSEKFQSLRGRKGLLRNSSTRKVAMMLRRRLLRSRIS